MPTGSSFQVVPPERWSSKSSASACAKCKKSFGFLRQADNCRACGGVFCTACLDNSMILPGQPGTAPVPTCDACANGIRRVHQDSEMAVHRCRILEDLLNEQTLHSERLTNQSKELREENDALIQVKENLLEQIKKLELEKEVIAAKASLTSPLQPSAASTSVSNVLELSSSSNRGQFPGGDDEASLEKRKRMLDMREATVQEALKKVSNDAAKLVSQRAQLQDLEKSTESRISKQLGGIFAEEKAALQDMFMEECDHMVAEFKEWMAKEAEEGMQRQQQVTSDDHFTLSTEELGRTIAELEERLAHERDAHMEELLAEREAMKLEREAWTSERAQEVSHPVADSECQATELAGEAALLDELQQKIETLEEQIAADKSRWEDDKLVLQGTVSALKRSLAANEAEMEALQKESKTASEERAKIELEFQAYRQTAVAEKEEGLHSAKQSFMDDYQSKLDALQTERDALAQSASESARNVQQAEATSQAELLALAEQHKTATHLLEEKIAALQAQLQEVSQQRADQPSQSHDTCAAEREEALHNLRASHEEEMQRLIQAKDTRQQEYETKLSDASDREQVYEARVQALEEAREKERLRSESLVLECAALSRRCEELEDRHGDGGNNAHDTSAEVIEITTHRDYDVTPMAQALLETCRQTQRALLTEHTRELQGWHVLQTAMMDSVKKNIKEMVPAPSPAGATTPTSDATQALQQKLKATKRECRGHESRAAELAQESLQLKRANATLTSEVDQLKEKLKKAARAASSAAAAAERAVAPVASVPQPKEVSSSSVTPVMTWAAHRQRLLVDYVDNLKKTYDDQLVKPLFATASALRGEVEKHRELCTTNAIALERTTGTIRTLKADLHDRDVQLRERENLVEQRLAQASRTEERMELKRQQIYRVCKSLRLVVDKLQSSEQLHVREAVASMLEGDGRSSSDASGGISP